MWKHFLLQHRISWMVICTYYLIRVRDPVREQPYCCLNVALDSIYVLEYIGQSEASLKEKPQCGLNVSFDFKVTRSCDTIISISKLEATLWVWCGFHFYGFHLYAVAIQCFSIGSFCKNSTKVMCIFEGCRNANILGNITGVIFFE